PHVVGLVAAPRKEDRDGEAPVEVHPRLLRVLRVDRRRRLERGAIEGHPALDDRGVRRDHLLVEAGGRAAPARDRGGDDLLAEREGLLAHLRLARGALRERLEVVGRGPGVLGVRAEEGRERLAGRVVGGGGRAKRRRRYKRGDQQQQA